MLKFRSLNVLVILFFAPCRLPPLARPGFTSIVFSDIASWCIMQMLRWHFVGTDFWMHVAESFFTLWLPRPNQGRKGHRSWFLPHPYVNQTFAKFSTVLTSGLTSLFVCPRCGKNVEKLPTRRDADDIRWSWVLPSMLHSWFRMIVRTK